MLKEGKHSGSILSLWAVAGEAKRDQINEQRRMGVQEGKTQEGEGGQGRSGKEPGGHLQTQQEGGRRDGTQAAAARELQMLKGISKKVS